MKTHQILGQICHIEPTAKKTYEILFSPKFANQIIKKKIISKDFL